MRKTIREGLTFDDVLIRPKYSKVQPGETNVSARLTERIELNIPLVSAAMDTVTEHQTAICIAREGGIGIIHRNMGIREQAEQVRKVKKSESGVISDPICVHEEATVGEVLKIMETNRISGIPVVVKGKLVGIITNRDLRFETDFNKKVSTLMTPKDRLVTAKKGTGIEEAKKILHKNRIEKLPLVDENFRLVGMVTVKDVEKTKEYPLACKDSLGRLRVGAAIGVGPEALKRAAALIEAGCDVISIDTAHGHSENVIRAIRDIRSIYPDIDIIGGNIATAEACKALIKASVNAVKVGIGPGSICTTRIVAGVGVPQITAIMEVSNIARMNGIPLIADGGIKFSGDITKAIAAGANTVMIGNLFAGTEETPGETVLYQGRTYKVYRGMGSLEVMREGKSRDRYCVPETVAADKIVPEGIEGRVPYRGPLSVTILQLVGGLRSGMGYAGCKNLDELSASTSFIQITGSGLQESHVHNVIITKEAPNYRIE